MGHVVAAQVVPTVAEVEGLGHIADIAFYKENHLAVLAGSGDDMEEAHFVLLPIDAMQHAENQPGSDSAQVSLALCSSLHFLLL